MVKRTNAHFTVVIVLLEGFIKYLTRFALEGFDTDMMGTGGGGGYVLLLVYWLLFCYF